MTIKSISLLLLCITVPSSAFFFGGGGSGCSCAPAPACAPPVASGCGGGGGGGYSGGYAQQSYSAPIAPAPVYSAPQQIAGFGSGGYVNSGGYEQQASYASQPLQAPIQQQPQYSAPAPVQSYASEPQAAPQSFQVQPSSVQYEGGYAASAAAAGDTLREVEDEGENTNSTTVQATTEIPQERDPVDIKEIKLVDDPECNSDELKAIINENVEEDLNSAKRLIQLAAEAKFGGRFDVICSTNDFSYVTNTELYCQHTKDTVSCYAYRQL